MYEYERETTKIFFALALLPLKIAIAFAKWLWRSAPARPIANTNNK